MNTAETLGHLVNSLELLKMLDVLITEGFLSKEDALPVAKACCDFAVHVSRKETEANGTPPRSN